MAMTAQAAQKASKPMGIAGDLASNPLVIPLLLGLGFNSLSVTAPKIPLVKEKVLAVHSIEARQIAQTALKMKDSQDVYRYLKELDERNQ